MKNNSKNEKVLRQVASHSLVAAIVTQPYLVALSSDLMNLSNSGGEQGISTVDGLPSSLAVISGAAFIIALIAFAGYHLLRKK